MYRQCLQMIIVYFSQNFRNALQEEWKVSLAHRCKLNFSFEESSAYVKYSSRFKGWNIVPDSFDCVVSH